MSGSPRPGVGSKLERAQVGLLAALAATIPVSIFAAELALVLVALAFATRLLRHETRLVRTSLDVPLLALVVWTVLSASFAADPAASLEDTKELLLLAVFYLGVASLASGSDRDRVLSAFLMGGIALSGLMVFQHHVLGYDTLGRRPSGFLGHWMTASGVVMAVLVTATARLAADRPRWPGRRGAWLAAGLVAGVGVVGVCDYFGAGPLPTRLFVAVLAGVAITVDLSRRTACSSAEASLSWVAVPLAAWALVVSQTRSAWVGALAGLAVVALTWAPRLLWVLAAVPALLFALHPEVVASRMTVSDVATVDRRYMWQAGIEMVHDRPILGHGPGMILTTYPRYRRPGAPSARQPHLHNNALQIAATRGLPGLAFFGWWTVVALAAALDEARRARVSGVSGWPAGAALGGLIAVQIAGLFEYNMGDSEVLMSMLLLTSLPFALRSERGATLASQLSSDPRAPRGGR